ncbi:unnamed protein product [Bursaphelenchus xylophilus]|uniref:(pine wood nematode) hypothetical protein n=1 Tax=Bursaphelenchus xylophilus TaxID=6326 RepID=A0A1I7SD21_BURXY|nr:unnamed protein product [Bursaphelenchus xylophilus]CAG9093078.1 unnamed protein product [Bursaphelenchus xylophilus]
MSIRYMAKRPKNLHVLKDTLYAGSTKKPIPNRLLKAALTERTASYDPKNLEYSGLPTQKILNLYEKWSKGGFGLVVTGNIPVDHRHLECGGNIWLDNEFMTEERARKFKMLARAMKSNGDTVALAQLSHAGHKTPAAINPAPYSASNFGITQAHHGVRFGTPVALTEDQIKTEIVDKFEFAAKVCRESGFDGIELNSAHGDIFAQFFSPQYNNRTDRYGNVGGDRLNILREVIQAVRNSNPADTGFLVALKVNLMEFIQDGKNVDEAILTCHKFGEIGIDLIEITGAYIEMPPGIERNIAGKQQFDYTINVAKSVKSSVPNTLVYLTGGFRTAENMIRAVEDKWTDGVGLGRPACAEPDFANKILQGQEAGALANSFEYDFDLAQLAANSQMEQAGRKPLEKSGFCDGITNLSTIKGSKKFKEGLEKYYEEMVKRAERGEVLCGVFEFHE